MIIVFIYYRESMLFILPVLFLLERFYFFIATEDYPIHFNNAMNNFYMHSTKNERNHFLDMATRLVAADKKISPRENLFLNELYNAWTEEIGF